MKPTVTDVNAALNKIEQAERDPQHPRSLARAALQRYRRGSAIDRNYDFSKVPVELRRIVYNATVRFSRRRFWARVLR